MQKKITIIGAGLVGSLSAIYLAKRGYLVNVYERRQDARKTNIYAGRSINLALSDRGWLALEKTGISADIKQIAIPMYGRQLHYADSSQAFYAYGKNDQAIYSVSRGTLNMRLLDLADAFDNVTLHFEHKAKSMDLAAGTVLIEHEGNDTLTHSDLVLCTDGAYSTGRMGMQLGMEQFNYNQFYIDCGYKELTIPAGANGSYLVEKEALHIWPRGKYMMIALPNLDGSFTCTLFFPFEGAPSFNSLQTREQVTQFFNEQFADAVAIMPELVDEYMRNHNSPLVTIKCAPWTMHDKFALMGDAAHALVPFFGQGMNCGFEDVRVFDELIDKHNENFTEVLKEYQTLRKPDADAIADMALNNFREMSELSADPMFQLQKKIEININAKYPEVWIPAYSLVTFSPQVRYSEALQRGQQQQRIMDTILQQPNISTHWDSNEIVEQAVAMLQAN
ncbi:MAG: FAD-dependent monooxygenase [Bacteroidia bacterium]|nr:FAD-dependent monooxygenase [Bacteroidia bacterium]